jgi:penicillin amidase
MKTLRRPRARVGRFLKTTACALLLIGCSSTPRMTRAERGFSANMDADRDRISIRVHGTRAPITVLLDGHAVPYVTAADENDLSFALGYLHARERRFQMELLRMDALGRLREMLGGDVPRAILRLELFSRMLGFPSEAAEVFAVLRAEDRRMLQAYADGVNEATRREQEPFEFRLLGYEPEPWTPEDSLSILALISFGFCKNWEQELTRLELMVFQLKTGSTIPRALGIWPARLDLPPHLIGAEPESDPFSGIPAVAPELARYLEDAFSGSAAEARLDTAPAAAVLRGNRAADSTPYDGLARSLNLVMSSNNWAVDGTWTGTGKSAIAMDPHMPLSLPPLLYISAIRLEGGYEVMGAGIPGLPALPFGTNGRVAWGPTSNWADVTDLYVELPAEEDPSRYRTENGDEPFTVRREVFRIRTPRGYRVEERTVRSTRHGVIVNDFIDRLPSDFPLVAIKRAQTFGRSLRSVGLLYRAGSVAEARVALEDLTVLVGHWALADSGGSIGYAGPVNLPMRKTHLGTVPVPGWTGEYEWRGFVPADELPGIENPEAHYLATANNQIVAPQSTGYPVNFEGDVAHRVNRILDRLSKGNAGGETVANLRSIQTDGTDASFLAVAPVIKPALEPLGLDKDARIAKAAGILTEWDGSVDPESPAPTIYQSFLSHLLIELVSDEVPPGTLDFLLFYFNADPLFFGILMDPQNPAWDDRGTPEAERPPDCIRRAFAKTVHALQKTYGGVVEEWRWKKAAAFDLSHSLGGVFPLSIFNRTGLPPRGTAGSVFMHKYDRSDPVRFPISYGPVLRIVVDFSDPPRSVISIPGGQSGRPFSPNYDDILPLFMRGDGIEMSTFKEMEARFSGRVDFFPDGVTSE